MTDTDAFLRALGKRVRIARLIQELTQEQLAEAAGMSRSFVSLIEKGTHGVDVVRLARLADALDLSPAELITGAHLRGADRPTPGDVRSGSGRPRPANWPNSPAVWRDQQRETRLSRSGCERPSTMRARTSRNRTAPHERVRSVVACDPLRRSADQSLPR